MAFVFAPAGVTSSSSSSWVDSRISVKKHRSHHQQGSPVMLSDYLNSLTKKLSGFGAQASPAKQSSNGYSNGNNGNGVVKPTPSPSASASSSASSSSGKKAPLSYAEYMKLRNGGTSGTPPSEIAPAPSASANAAPAAAKPVVSSGGNMNYLENLEKKTPGNLAAASAPVSSSYLESLTKQQASTSKQSTVPSAPSSYLESISGKRASNGASAAPKPTPAPVTSSSSAPKKTSASSISYEEYMKQRGKSVPQAPATTKPQSVSAAPSKPAPAPAAAPSSDKSGSVPLSFDEYMKARGIASSASAAPAAKSAAKPAVSMPGSGNYLEAVEKQSKSSSVYSTSSVSAPSSGSSYLDSLTARSAMTAPTSTVRPPSSGSYLDSLTNKQVTTAYSTPAAYPRPAPTQAAPTQSVPTKPAVPGNTTLPTQNKAISVDLAPPKPLNPVESVLKQAKSGVMDYLDQFKMEDPNPTKPVETPRQPTRSTTSVFYSPAPASKPDSKSESNPLAPSASGPMGLESMQSVYILIALWSSGICFAIFFYYVSHPK